MISKSTSEGLRLFAIVLLVTIGFNAIAAGYSFITDPSGHGIGMSTDYLRHSPFNNFLFPGLLLFTANGILGLITAWIAFKKLKAYRLFIIIQGFILLGWILIQVMLVRDFNLMHFISLVFGILLVAVGWLLYSRKD